MGINARIETWQLQRNRLTDLQDELDETDQGDWSAVDELKEMIEQQLYACVGAATVLVGELAAAVNYDWKALETKLGSENN